MSSAEDVIVSQSHCAKEKLAANKPITITRAVNFQFGHPIDFSLTAHFVSHPSNVIHVHHVEHSIIMPVDQSRRGDTQTSVSLGNKSAAVHNCDSDNM